MNNFSTNDDVVSDLNRFSNLLLSQRIWAVEWQELADYINPRKNSILVQRIPGSKRTQKLYDSTAPDAADLLASAMHGTLTSSHLRWFYLETDDPQLNQQQNVRIWLDQASQKMNDRINQSNFHSEVHEHYMDMVVFATASLFCTAKPPEKGQFGGLQFTSCHIGHYVIAEGADSTVNTQFRSFVMTLNAIRAKWPDVKIKELEDSTKFEDKYEIIHSVYPIRSFGKLNKKWRSRYILARYKAVLQEGGFYSFPFMVSRWSKNNDEEYGRGQSHLALPDIRSLNKIVELELKATAKVVDPPMGAVSGDVIGQARLVPGGVTTVRNKDALFPILTGINFEVNNLKKEELRSSIKSIYKIDQLQLPTNGPQMTATETHVRYEIMQRILGPSLGRLEIEFTHPLIDRVFDLLYRAGDLPPLPMELRQASSVRKVGLKIRYEGPLARAQKSSDADAIGQLLQAVEPIAKIKPEALDVINFDAAIRKYGEIIGTPAEIIRDESQVETLRQEQEKQHQDMLQQQQIGQAASAAKNVSPLVRSLNQAPEPGSQMESLVNAGQQRAAA